MIDKIKKNGLCLGCGLCSSYLGRNRCSMLLDDDGFYRPYLRGDVSQRESRDIERLCPGVTVIAENRQPLWGNLLHVKEGWSKDNEIRKKASSGGVVTALALYMLESGKVDGILQVGRKEDNWLYNELHISWCREDVLRNIQSRYAPALVFDTIFNIFKRYKDKKFMFIGKPCDVVAIRNVLRMFPEYKTNIVICVSIFCAGIPSYNASINLATNLYAEGKPNFIKYRGDGWPGDFEVRYDDGEKRSMSYNESWGKNLCRQLNFRCKVCPDGIGLLADIAVGDNWITKDGYPDFSEADGRSLILVRNSIGNDAIKGAVDESYIESKEFSIDNISSIQPSQNKKRMIMGARIFAVQLLSCNLLNFSNLSMYRNTKGANLKLLFSAFVGTVKRFIAVKR